MRSICLPLALAILLFAALQAQQLPPTPVYRIGPDMDPPLVLHRAGAEYSDEARAARLQGSVLVSAVIGEDGRPRALRVVKPLGLGLDEKALAAAANWDFLPALKTGQPVAVECTFDIGFHLQADPGDWSVASLAFSGPQGARTPVLLTAQYRPIAGIPERAEFRLSFDVDADGHPINIHVDNSSDPKDDDEVIALIREWRFQAALASGSAIQSHAEIDLTRGLPVQEPAPPAMLNGQAVPKFEMIAAPRKKQ